MRQQSTKIRCPDREARHAVLSCHDSAVHRTLNHLAGLIRRSRWRRLDPGRHALLALPHLPNGDTLTLSDLPALVLSAKSDVLAWNPLAAALFGDFSGLPLARRNLIRRRFLGTGIGTITLSPDSDSAADCVGCLRTAQARYPDDPDLARLVSDLRAGSTRFDSLWQAGRSGRVRASSVTVTHLQLGRLTLDCDVLLVPEADQSVLLYSAAAGTPEASALELLRVTDLEQFAQ